MEALATGSGFELLEYLGHRPAERTRELGVGEFGRKRRHLVLQPCQLVAMSGGSRSRRVDSTGRT